MENIEVWKSINGYDGIYEISNYGRVKSVGRIVSHSHIGKLTIKEHIRKLSNNKDGYLSVSLSKKGKLETFLVHILVAKAFIPNPFNLPEVNHKKGIKTDNRATELEWSTRGHNMSHAVKTELIRKGERVSFSKLTEKDVLEIRKSSLKQCELAKIYGVKATCINKIKSRQNWKHI